MPSSHPRQAPLSIGNITWFNFKAHCEEGCWGLGERCGFLGGFPRRGPPRWPGRCGRGWADSGGRGRVDCGGSFPAEYESGLEAVCWAWVGVQGMGRCVTHSGRDSFSRTWGFRGNREGVAAGAESSCTVDGSFRGQMGVEGRIRQCAAWWVSRAAGGKGPVLLVGASVDSSVQGVGQPCEEVALPLLNWVLPRSPELPHLPSRRDSRPVHDESGTIHAPDRVHRASRRDSWPLHDGFDPSVCPVRSSHREPLPSPQPMPGAR